MYKIEPLAPMTEDEIMAAVAPTLQPYLDSDLDRNKITWRRSACGQAHRHPGRVGRRPSKLTTGSRRSGAVLRVLLGQVPTSTDPVTIVTGAEELID